MTDELNLDLETDPRFPTGKWVGFFLQQHVRPGRHGMELNLAFQGELVTGEGRDVVGDFVVRGRYELAGGTCHWTKKYLGKHDVFYKGYNEGKGIWGLWEIPSEGLRGGFHVWPEGMPDPTNPTMHEEADLPAPAFEDAAIRTPILVPALTA